MPVSFSVRIDKWLWAVRLFKTRSMAAEACRSGKVKLGECSVKPSHEARIGEIYSVVSAPINRTIRVKAFLHNRVSAKLVPDFLEDLTPLEEYRKLEMMKEMKQGIRPRGYGRPAKKDRRDMEKFRSF